jgi:hypothetical protein
MVLRAGVGLMGASLAERFEAKVDRSGAHHIWTGSKVADGSGKLKVHGRSVSARRVAWELAHGPLPSGVVVISCPDEIACVRVDHLSIRGAPDQSVVERRRAPRGGGSKTEVRPGVWKLTVSAGRYDDGRQRRLHRTVHASTASATSTRPPSTGSSAGCDGPASAAPA